MIRIAELGTSRLQKRAERVWGMGLAHVGLALLMAVLTRAAPVSLGAPFAIACFCAGLMADKSAVAMLIGCFFGCPWELGTVQVIAPLMGCLTAQLLFILAKRLPLLSDARTGELRMKDALCAGLAGVSMLASALPFAREFPYDLMMALVNAVLALACAPTMISAISMNPRRSKLLSEEQLSLVLLSLAMLIGLRLIPIAGVPLAHLLAAGLTLMGACCSVGAGAVAGVLCGSALTLIGDSPYVGVALALCGLLAGAAKPLGRPAMALAFLLGNAISLIYTSGSQIGAINPYVALLAGVGLCFVPPQVERRVAGWFVPAPMEQDSERMVTHMRQDAEKRVRALGLLFEEMSAGYETPSPLPDEQALVGRMRERLCEGCSNYAHCWSGGGKGNRLLVEMLSDTLCGRLMDATQSTVPPDIMRRCRRAAQIPRRLGPLLSDFDQQRRAAKERGECKALLSSQFHQASEALLSEGDKLARPVSLDRDLVMRVSAALDREGLNTDAIWAVEDDLPQLFIGLRNTFWNRSAAGKASRGLSKILGMQMKPAVLGDGIYQDELCFVPAPRLSVDVGFAGRAGQGGTLSGDSHLTGALNDGRVLLALSDGMGSGQRAAAESASALKLLKRFLSAGVPCSMALDGINELMLLRSGDEMFATADLCVLDLSACRAEFSKLGGCASLLLRGERTIVIEGGRLPMGVLNKVSPAEASVRLRVDDLIVMVTDGVLDNAQDGQVEWLEQQLRRHLDEPPQKLCERIVSAAAARAGAHKDDITALVARIGPA